MVAVTKERVDTFEQHPQRASFLERKRPDLKEILSQNHPLVAVSMEAAVPDGFFAGGLGALEGDKWFQAGDLGIPYTLVTLAYRYKGKQVLYTNTRNDGKNVQVVGFSSEEEGDEVDFTKTAWQKDDSLELSHRANGDTIPLTAYTQTHGSATALGLHEPGIDSLYAQKTDSEHRMYQQAIVGFGGYKALKEKGVTPAGVILNESATALFAVAMLDDLCSQGTSFKEALDLVKQKTVYVNHTLEQAAEAEFSPEIFDKYVKKNVLNQEVKDWLDSLKNENGTIRLNTIALSLSSKQLGVSKFHTEVANGEYTFPDGSKSHPFKDHTGKEIHFIPETNGIYVKRWAHDSLLRVYNEGGIFDEDGIPTPDYQKRIDDLDPENMQTAKMLARHDMRGFLKTRKDQYGNPIDIPLNAKVAVWARRFAGYKRPGMLFQDPERLAKLLEEKNTHIILSGKYGGDNLINILNLVNSNEVLKDRVHFVSGYNDETAKYLASGSDMWINTPIKGKEACGTSWEKAIVNGTFLISRADGGVKDVEPAPCLTIEGETYEEEVDSLYFQLEKAADIIDGNNESSWADFAKYQLKGYLPIISGVRMMEGYINDTFPPQEEEPSTNGKLNGQVTGTDLFVALPTQQGSN